MIIAGFVFIAVAIIALFSDWRAALILAAIGAGALFVALRSG
jgi:uncharacterized membrane protein